MTAPRSMRPTRRRVALGAAVAALAATTVLASACSGGATATPPAGAAQAGGDAAPATTGAPDPTTSPTTVPAPETLPSERPAAAVGRTTLTVEDGTRSTGARGDQPAHEGRTLRVTVRYPTSGAPGPDEVTGAPPIGRSPLVVFAHGFDASPDTYADLLHDLAAAGFVVAAPDFPLSTSDADASPVEGDEGEQARDLSTVIDRLTDWVTGPALAEAIRPGPVGLVGHSDGAVTVLLAGYSPEYADGRVGAVVDVSGAYDTYGGPWFTTADPPLLSVHGSDDEINAVDNDVEVVEQDPGPAVLVVVGGASHLGAVTGRFERPVARLVADDLAWRLEDAAGGAEAVARQAATSPLSVAAGTPG